MSCQDPTDETNNTVSGRQCGDLRRDRDRMCLQKQKKICKRRQEILNGRRLAVCQSFNARSSCAAGGEKLNTQGRSYLAVLRVLACLALGAQPAQPFSLSPIHAFRSALSCSLFPHRQCRGERRVFSGASRIQAGGRTGSAQGNDDDGYDEQWGGPIDNEWQNHVRNLGSAHLGDSREQAGRSPLNKNPNARMPQARVRDPWQEKLMEERVLFPRCSKAALEQAADAVDHALNQGIFRLRVQMNLEHFDLNHQTLAESSLPLLINTLAARLVERGQRVCLLFNTLADAAEATSLLLPELQGAVGINVLGLGHFDELFDVAVLVCASNEGHANLQRIEAVERLLYAGPPARLTKKVDKTRYMERPIILINPSLEAIHSMASSSRKVKPMFMGDFTMVYYLDAQVAVHSRSLDAALFHSACQVPVTWQLWMRDMTALSPDSAMPPSYSYTSVQTMWDGDPATFRLIWEKSSFPTEMDLSVMYDLPSSNVDWLHSAASKI